MARKLHTAAKAAPAVALISHAATIPDHVSKKPSHGAIGRIISLVLVSGSIGISYRGEFAVAQPQRELIVNEQFQHIAVGS
jgi:hypothetical protein